MEKGRLLCSAGWVYNDSEPVCNEGLCKRHTHTPEVTLLFLDSNNMAAALLSIGREKSFSVHQVQSWSAKKQLKLEVKLEGSQGQVGILPFHHRDYHLLLHQGPLSADTDVQRLVFSE